MNTQDGNNVVRVGDKVSIAVREEHDREEYIGIVEEINLDRPNFEMAKVVFSDGFWQWTPLNRLRYVGSHSEEGQ